MKKKQAGAPTADKQMKQIKAPKAPKAEPVYTLTSFTMIRDAGAETYRVIPEAALRDGAPILADTLKAQAQAELEAAREQPVDEFTPAWLDWSNRFTAGTLSEEELVELEDAKLAALDQVKAAYKSQRKADKAATRATKRQEKLASASALVSAPADETPPANEPAPDPIQEGKLLALRALAKDLGVKVKGSGTDTKLVEPVVKAPRADRAVAAKLLLKQALKAITTKAGASISSDNLAKLQLAHDALALITEGALCQKTGAANSVIEGASAMMTNGVTPPASAPLDPAILEPLTKAVDGLREVFLGDAERLADRLTTARAEAARLTKSIEDLRHMPLGRPTQANADVRAEAGAATWADMASAGAGNPPSPALTPEDIKAGTSIATITRGGSPMTVRQWPEGYAKDNRPPLSPLVMPYMLMADIIAYREGHAANVPELG